MSEIAIPVEVLRQIFSYLQFSDTVSVARVSRQWNACSEGQLYTELQLTQPNSSLMLLLRTLLTTGLERLATYVRIVDVNWEFVSIRPMDECDVAVLVGAAARIGLSQILHSIDEQVWLLLHLLPRLDSLTIDALTLESIGYSTTINALIGGMHDHANIPLALRSIRYISFLDVAPAETFRAMFLLPCNPTLDLYILDAIEVPFPAADHRTSGVTDLRLSLSWVDSVSIGHILHLPRALTRLAVMIGYVQHTGLLALLRAALEPVRMTLQQLKVDVVETFWYEEAPIESFLLLRTWPMLRRLWCPLNWLLGRWTEDAELHLYSVLPRSLRELWVHGDHVWTRGRLLPEVILLVQRKEEEVPVLEGVCIKPAEEYEIEEQRQVDLEQQLACICADAGVVLAGMGDW